MIMKENILIEKSIEFGARIVKLHQYLIKAKHETVLSKQILLSGTSIGANINEAQYGNSKSDFTYCFERDRRDRVLAAYSGKIRIPG